MGGGKRAKARRNAIMQKAQQNGHGAPTCTYCGARLSRKPEAYDAKRGEPLQFFTMDHIVPRANGGCHDLRCLAAACRVCNEERATMPLDEFIESLGDKAVITVEKAREMMREAQSISEARRYWSNRL